MTAIIANHNYVKFVELLNITDLHFDFFFPPTFLKIKLKIPSEHHVVELDAQIRVGWQNLLHLDFDFYFFIISSSQTLENHL